MLSPFASPQRGRGAPPPAPPLAPPAPPPPPPNPTAGSMVPPPQAGRGGLLASIEGFSLRNLTHRSPNPQRGNTQPAWQRQITGRRGAIAGSPQDGTPPTDLISQLQARMRQTQQTIAVLQEEEGSDEESGWEDTPVRQPQLRPIQQPQSPPRSPYVAGSPPGTPLHAGTPPGTPLRVESPPLQRTPPRTPVHHESPQRGRQRRNSDPGTPLSRIEQLKRRLNLE